MPPSLRVAWTSLHLAASRFGAASKAVHAATVKLSEVRIFAAPSGVRDSNVRRGQYDSKER